MIAGVYLVELAALLKVYGGLKLGHLARWNIILSQFLALFICNAIMAVQIILIVGDMHLIAEILKSMLLLMLIDICLAILLVYVFDALLRKLYPAKHILLVYDEYSPEPMIAKFVKRSDKYIIQESVSVNMNEQKLYENMSEDTCGGV